MISDEFRFGRHFATSHMRSRPVTTATWRCVAPQRLPACWHIKSRKDADVGIVSERHFGHIARVTWLHDRHYRLDMVDLNVGPFRTFQPLFS